MKKIFLILDIIDSRIKKSNFEILSHLIQNIKEGLEIHAYSHSILDEDQIGLLKPYNIKTLYMPEEKSDILLIDHYKATIRELIKEKEYDAYLSISSDWNNMVMTAIASEKGINFYENCTGLEIEQDIILKKPYYGDKIISDIRVKTPFTASFRQKSFEICLDAKDGLIPETIRYSLILPPIEWVFEGAEDLDDVYAKLTDVLDAEVIISVGRGIQDKEKISMIEELVELFGEKACLGASRVVVDQGWASFSCQVGQTGKIVSPVLYIALGISGAVQHQVGMNPAKYIISVNKDSEAPVFEISDYGIVDDLFEFVPLLIKELKELKE